MLRTTFITSIATLALVSAAPAIAGPGGGGGHGGGPGGGAGAPAGPMGGPGSAGMGAGAGPMGSGIGVGAGAGSGPMTGGLGSTVRDTARSQSQGPANANPTAIDRANQNSVLSTGTNTTTTVNGNRIQSSGRNSPDVSVQARSNSAMSANTQLTGVTSGMTVVDSTGATIGTVSSISTKGNGSVRNVQVTLTNGQVITLAPSSLSLSNGVLTTDSVTSTANASNRRVNSQGPANASIQGLTHASPNSVLSSAGITTLTGLTTGLTVNNSAGTSIGTVSGVLTNRAGAVVGIQVNLTGGGTVTIPATTLTMNGTTVVTSSTQF